MELWAKKIISKSGSGQSEVGEIAMTLASTGVSVQMPIFGVIVYYN